MINLLPLEEKRQIQAGRSNVLLVRYNFLLSLVISLLLASMAMTYYFLSMSTQAADTTILDNQKREASYADVKVQAETFRSQLGEAKSVLDGSISYSKAVLAISELIPSGVVLKEIKLDQTSFTQPIVITALVKGEQNAYDLQEAFVSSSNFSNATFVSTSDSSNKEYPFTVTLQVSMNKEAAQ